MTDDDHGSEGRDPGEERDDQTDDQTDDEAAATTELDIPVALAEELETGPPTTELSPPDQPPRSTPAPPPDPPPDRRPTPTDGPDAAAPLGTSGRPAADGPALPSRDAAARPDDAAPFASGLRSAIAFLTLFGGRAPVPDGRTMVWFPAVGAALGAVLGGLWWAGSSVWPPLLVAAVVVGLDLALTGLLHVDGLADAADGLLPPLADRERRLAVMADPATGAFGVAVVVITLFVRAVALSAVPTAAGRAVELSDALLLVALWCASRALMAAAALRLPYARPGGLASSFRDGDASRLAVPIAVGGLGVAVVVAALAAGGRGVAGLVALSAAVVAVHLISHNRIGGFTGDVLGAAAVVGETVGLLVLAAHW